MFNDIVNKKERKSFLNRWGIEWIVVTAVPELSSKKWGDFDEWHEIMVWVWAIRDHWHIEEWHEWIKIIEREWE